MNQPNILGIDIAKLKFDVALIVQDKFKTKVFANNPAGFQALSVWLIKHQTKQIHACMEATNSYGEALAHYLLDQGLTVSVVNPAQIKFFAQSKLTRNKNDLLDAQIIARFCQMAKPTPFTPAPAHIRQLQALVQRVKALIDMQTQEKNRLVTAQDIIKTSLQDSLNSLASQITSLKKLIAQHIQHHPDLQHKSKLLLSIPGVGEATVACVLGFLPNIKQFAHQNQIVAFAGLNPKQKLSGSSVHGKSCLSKIGHAPLRKALFLPAMVALQHNPIFKQLSARMTANHKPKMVILGAAMRKLLVIIYGVLKSNKPFDLNLAMPG